MSLLLLCDGISCIAIASLVSFADSVGFHTIESARMQSISYQLLTLSEPCLVDTVYTVDSTVEAFDIIYQSCVYKTLSTQ